MRHKRLIVSTLGLVAVLIVAWLLVLLAPAALKEPPSRETDRQAERDEALLKKALGGRSRRFLKVLQDQKAQQQPRDPSL